METDADLQPRLATRWKRLPRSLRIFLWHTGVVAVSLLMMASPLSRQPGAMHPVLLLPFFYLLFCPLTYLLVVVIGIRDVTRRPGKAASGIALGGSVLALTGICRFVAYYWDAMMYI